MIPFSILSGQLLAEGNSIQEISILDVSRIGFPCAEVVSQKLGCHSAAVLLPEGQCLS